MTKYGKKKKLEPEMALYEFNENTFELKLKQEKSTSRRNTSRFSRLSNKRNRQMSNSVSYKTPKKPAKYIRKTGVVEGKVRINFLPQIESGVCILDSHMK
jgi:hypothetical protein